MAIPPTGMAHPAAGCRASLPIERLIILHQPTWVHREKVAAPSVFSDPAYAEIDEWIVCAVTFDGTASEDNV